MNLTVDERRHLTAVAYGHMSDTASGTTVIKASRAAIRSNAKVAVVERLVQRAWIVRDSGHVWRLTDAGKTVWEAS